MVDKEILTWTLWRHHSGRIYRVTGFTNIATSDPDKFPPTVVYESLDTGYKWSRPIIDFQEKFEPEGDYP